MSPGAWYLGVNHELMELLGHIHPEGLESVTGATPADAEVHPCLLQVEVGNEIALMSLPPRARGVW